jgi:hypothetical protein
MSPSRLDSVKVLAGDRLVEVAWADRQLLLGRLRSNTAAQSIVIAFEAVGATRPVELDDSAVEVLVAEVNQLSDLGDLPDGSFACAQRWPT